MVDKMKGFMMGTIAIAMAVFLVGSLTILILNAFAILGAASAAALRAVGIY